MVPAEDPNIVNLFKGRLTEDPTLDTAAKLMSSKFSILKDPKMKSSDKKQAIKQIDPSIKLYIRKLRQLPAPFTSGMDPKQIEKILKDEEEDLGTPVQQKLLKRILSGVTPKKEEERTGPVKRLPPPVIKRQSKKQKTAGPNVSWSELPFVEESPDPDLECTVERALRRLRKSSASARTPYDVRQLRPAKGWTSWDPSGKKKRKKKSSSSSSSISKQLTFEDS